MRTIRVFALATLAVFAFASTAQAATIRFAHQDWHRFKSSGKLGQKWDPAMVSKSQGRLTERIQGDVAGGVFAEGKVGDSKRREIIATRHWGVGRSHLKQHRVRANFTRWHHITVVWKRHKMNVRLDGVRFAHFTRHIAKTPMALKIQTAGANVGGAVADARLQVEHLKIS